MGLCSAFPARLSYRFIETIRRSEGSPGHLDNEVHHMALPELMTAVSSALQSSQNLVRYGLLENCQFDSRLSQHKQRPTTTVSPPTLARESVIQNAIDRDRSRSLCNTGSTCVNRAARVAQPDSDKLYEANHDLVYKLLRRLSMPPPKIRAISPSFHIVSDRI